MGREEERKGRNRRQLALTCSPEVLQSCMTAVWSSRQIRAMTGNMLASQRRRVHCHLSDTLTHITSVCRGVCCDRLLPNPYSVIIYYRLPFLLDVMLTLLSLNHVIYLAHIQ